MPFQKQSSGTKLKHDAGHARGAKLTLGEKRKALQSATDSMQTPNTSNKIPVRRLKTPAGQINAAPHCKDRKTPAYACAYCVYSAYYFVIHGTGSPCSKMPGPKAAISPVSGLVGWSI